MSRGASPNRASACQGLKQSAVDAHICEVELQRLVEKPNGTVQGIGTAVGILHAGDGVGDRHEADRPAIGSQRPVEMAAHVERI